MNFRSWNFLLLFSCLLGQAAEACVKWQVIVDGYSSGSAYPQELERRGYCIAHVATRDDPLKYYQDTFERHRYKKLFSIQKDGYHAVLDALRVLRPEAVIAGAETGVIVANEYAKAMRLPFNGGNNIKALVDKYEFYKLMKKNGLPYIPSMVSNYFSQEDIQKWIDEEQLTWPIVAKPRASAGTDGFHLCEDWDDLKKAFEVETASGRRDYHGNPITELLLQKYEVGGEIASNYIISKAANIIFPFSKWRYHPKLRQAGSLIYDRETLLTTAEMLKPEMLAIDKAATDVFRVLEMQVGPAHPEVINGKVVDLNARLPGANIPGIEAATVGRDMISTSVDSFLDWQKFLQSIAALPPVTQRLDMVDFVVGLGVYGQFHSYNMPEFPDPSVYNKELSRFYLDKEEIIRTTRDMDTSPGSLILFGDDDKVEAAYRTFRDHEQSGNLYRYTPLEDPSCVLEFNSAK